MTISLPVPWSSTGLLQFAELTAQLLALSALVLIPMFFLFVLIYGHFILRVQQEHVAWRLKAKAAELADEKEEFRIWRDCALVYLQRLADGLAPHPGYGERAKIVRPITGTGKHPD